MSVSFVKAKNDLVAVNIDGKTVCHVIGFDIESLPPQIFVAMRSAYKAGIDAGIAQKQEELRKVLGG